MRQRKQEPSFLKKRKVSNSQGRKGDMNQERDKIGKPALYHEEKMYSLLQKRKRFILELRDELGHMSLIMLVEYWRNHENIDCKDIINEMVEHNIFPKTFADGKDFTIGGLRHIGYKAVIECVNDKCEWSESKKNKSLPVMLILLNG